MIYLNWGLALVVPVLAVCLVICFRQKRKKVQALNKKVKQLQEKIDALYRENLFLKNIGKEYTIASDYEVNLLKTPPIFVFVRKQYRPIIRFEGTLENWKFVLVGAEIYVKDSIGDDTDGALVVERCVNRISAEAFDDFLCQLRQGFYD